MKTFEEKFTAWIDGELTGSELLEFEASLADKAAAEAEKRDAQKLGAFLRTHAQSHAMGNEEFFNHQLREQIERDEEAETPASAAGEEVRAGWWTIRRLLWGGIASLAVFVVCTFFVIRQETTTSPSPYLTQILNTRLDPAAGPNATVSIFQTKEEKVTVLWVEGLQSLPSEYAAK